MYPPSAIRDTSLHEVVHELPLCRDVAEHILSFIDPFIVFDNDPDLFWFTLGRETCNLYLWNHHCHAYACNAFGKSAKISQQLNMYKLIVCFKGNLDGLFCAYYGIESEEEYRFRERFDNISITDVFYNNYSIQNPPTPDNRLRKYFHEHEKHYISTFITRFKEYLDNLESTIDDIPYKSRSSFVYDTRKRIKSGILKARQKLDKRERH